MKDHHPSHMEIPNSFYPIAQTDITECSTYAVVCRLKSSPTYTITSNGGSFIHPDFPGVTVTIPENAVDPNADFPLELKVQEVPSDEFQDEEVLIGPILRISCCEVVQFLRPVTIQLPISLQGQQDLNLDPTTCRVRVLFLKSDDKQKEWIEITDDLVGPAIFDGEFVRFPVKRFSGYSFFFYWRKLIFIVNILRITRFLNSLIWCQPRPADFFAYFQPGSSTILSLICCDGQVKQQVIQELKVDGISHASSKKNMIPEYDKAFVFVSGGIRLSNREEMEDCYLRLREGDLPFHSQLEVDVVDAEHKAQVKFRNTSEPTGLLLCTLNLSIPTQNTNSTRSYARRPPPLRVTSLGDEWGSSKGGLSTLNRELVKHLAQQPDVEVTLLLPDYSDKEKQEANECYVSLVASELMSDFDPIKGLSSPLEDLDIDVVIGHGQKLGAPAQALAKQRRCKRVHIVHTASEEIAMYKKSNKAISGGEEKHRKEVGLCKEADIIVAIGPKLTEAISANLRRYGKDEHVINITPGVFSEFSKLKQASKENEKFRILVFGRGDPDDFELKGYDIAARAVAGLNDETYVLTFVGAPKEKEEEVKGNLLVCGISPSQLIVRGYIESRKTLEEYFCEADLAIMPSRTEGYGFTALEALSAGLPILVCENSGLGKALQALTFGSSVVVGSDDAEEWGKAIKGMRKKTREIRLHEARSLRESYNEMYSWETQCEMLVEKMRSIF